MKVDGQTEKGRKEGRETERGETERVSLFGWLVGWFLNVLVNY